VISSTAASIVGEAWTRHEQFVCFDETLDCSAGPSALEIREAICDYEQKVRQVKTPCTDDYELAAQRWLIASSFELQHYSFFLLRILASPR